MCPTLLPRLLLLGCSALFACTAPSTSAATGAPPTPPNSQRRLVPLRNVLVTDHFWAPKLAVWRDRTIPHSSHYMDWELRALRHAAGEKVEGELNGTWGEANLYKFLETIAYSLAQWPDPELERRVDAIIELLGQAQRADGYSHIYVLNSGKTPWDPAFLDGSHDGYVLGHMIEAAIEYHAATGKSAFLDIARRAADQAHRHFLGPHGTPGFCGHAELEMALVELFRVTREPRYLELSQAFVEWRGRGLVPPAGPTPRAYFQDAVPLRQQRTLEGHAVRAVFFATGVTDLALETSNPDYRLAAQRFWQSTAERRLAITGSIGPREEHEAFGEDYELPHEGYYECCAACGLADFAQRMFLLEGDSAYADVLEQVLYNAVLHGISLDGTTTYYRNPLTDHDHGRHNSWVCCPPNLSRTLMQVGRYSYAHTGREIYVNLFIGGSCRFPLDSGEVTLHVDSSCPWEDKVVLRPTPNHPQPFALLLRRPGWCATPRLLLNGEIVHPTPINDHGYIALNRTWSAGDQVELHLPMPVQWMQAHPNVQSCAAQVALQRGPLIYAFEGLDHHHNLDLAVDPELPKSILHQPDLLGGITVIRGTDGHGKPFLALPFYTLANRQPSSQKVWLPLAQPPSADASWWEGKLYRPWITRAPASSNPAQPPAAEPTAETESNPETVK